MITPSSAVMLPNVVYHSPVSTVSAAMVKVCMTHQVLRVEEY